MSTETFTQTKQQLEADALKQMQKVLEIPHWSIREKLALTCRILYEDGQSSELAGQITARGEQSGTYYTQRFGLGFDEISPSSLLLVDEDLNVLEGDGMPNPGARFHSWLYRARPDVNCIVHDHAPYLSALSMLEKPLVCSHMDTTPLYGDCAFLDKWPGTPVGNEEGRIISEAIGDKRAIFLAHHGPLVACASVEEACVLALVFERAARLQLLAAAAGEIRELPPDLAREAHDWRLSQRRLEATFAYRARWVLRKHPDCLSE